MTTTMTASDELQSPLVWMFELPLRAMRFGYTNRWDLRLRNVVKMWSLSSTDPLLGLCFSRGCGYVLNSDFVDSGLELSPGKESEAK